ncbi:NAD-dependent succinate-semialdehyde dehydrogenase [Phenylobacterium sp.]|jgi:succinate-semialdehyde dehydrogenase/glutarate-semialdehyde dehydrogenase|uniref:NAD-dependent succinate-semialdehyde dehydrogenase n=1 Tax=Phenylobacterium sp. TaxID=1871053 RepID=UPI0037837360
MAGERPVFQIVNPATNEPGRKFEGITGEEALAIARKAHKAFDGWKRTSFEERARLMREAANVLRRRADEFAEMMSEEMGKTLADGRAEVLKCATGCEFYADNAERLLADEMVDMGGPKSKVVYRPLGTILAVMPWNYPFWQAFRFAAPTLMAGNTAVLKHASNVPASALAIEEVFKEAGFPEDVFRTVLIPSRDVKALIDDDSIAAISLTGSVEAGKQVAAAAGMALKKCVLELGGSDAYLVLEDADIDKAAKVAAAARLVNAGQSCIAGKRFIVLPAVREAFEQALVREMETYVLSDPKADGAKLGPLVSVSARDEIHEQVERSIAAGAKLLTGGKVPDKAGAWYPATVLTNVKPGNPAFDEEVFGPVAAVIEAKDEAEAVELANNSDFGLGSGVLTRDLARGERLASDELNAGMSFVNINVRSDARLPFGGIKHSGYGRELATFGIREFVNIKSVLVEPA